MAQTTADDLTHASDIELDAALQIGFNKHRNATGDERAELHAAIVAILAEQARRLDGWLDHTLGVE